MFDGNSDIWTGSSNHTTWTRKAVVTISLYWAKENVARTDWPYDEQDR